MSTRLNSGPIGTTEVVKETFISSIVSQLEEMNSVVCDINSLVNGKSVELFGPPCDDECESDGCAPRPGRTGQVSDQIELLDRQLRHLRTDLRNLFADLV